MPSSRVFITNKGAHDYRAAEKFGPLIFITEGELNKFLVGEMFRRCQTELHDVTENDFLLPTGLPILVGMASAIVMHKTGKINYLLYKNNQYMIRSIYLGGRGVDE